MAFVDYIDNIEKLPPRRVNSYYNSLFFQRKMKRLTSLKLLILKRAKCFVPNEINNIDFFIQLLKFLSEIFISISSYIHYYYGLYDKSGTTGMTHL